MSSVQAIREGIDARLATISGLRHSAVVPAVISGTPYAFVKRRSTTFDVTTDGEDDLTLAITLLVSWAKPDTAQETMDPYLASTGTLSIKAAIDGDPTLGGAVDWARVAAVEDERIAQFAGTDYLACDLVVEVG